jgi:hypothetical protein
MRNKKNIFLLILLTCFLIFFFIQFSNREKNEWIKLNEKISIFNADIQFKYFEEINNRNNKIAEEIQVFKNKFPKWRVNDLDEISKNLNQIVNNKLFKFAEYQVEYISKSLIKSEIKIIQLDRVIDSLIFYQTSLTTSNSNRINKIKENINEEKKIILFEISWNKKIKEIDNEIKKYIEEKWLSSDTVKKYNTTLREYKIKEPKISDLQIIFKVCDKEIESKFEKRFYFSFQAIAKGETKVNSISKLFKFGEDKNWIISAEGKVGLTGRYNYEPYFIPETFQAIQLKINKY